MGKLAQEGLGEGGPLEVTQVSRIFYFFNGFIFKSYKDS